MYNCGVESQSLVSVPDKPELNPKSLRNAYDVMAYVLLIPGTGLFEMMEWNLIR